MRVRQLVIRHGAYDYPQEREDFVGKSMEILESPTISQLWSVLIKAAGSSIELDVTEDGQTITLLVADGGINDQ